VKHAQEPTYSFVILTLVLILVNTALAWLSVKFIPAGTGDIALVYIAVAFMILFALWFGAYGVIAAYVGTLFAGVLTTESLLQALIPLVAARIFEIDLTLAHRRDWTIILLFAVLINNVVGAAWGAFTLSFLGPVDVVGAFSTWLAGNIIITLLVVPLALRFLTEKVSTSKLFVRHYWD
jgi:hypothetical protein